MSRTNWKEEFEKQNEKLMLSGIHCFIHHYEYEKKYTIVDNKTEEIEFETDSIKEATLYLKGFNKAAQIASDKDIIKKLIVDKSENLSEALNWVCKYEAPSSSEDLKEVIKYAFNLN